MSVTVSTFLKMKAEGKKISMITAYDYTTARLVDESGIDSILVGDSLGNVMLGLGDTVSVTMEDMIHHGAAVARGAKNALVVVDMPFMSYQSSVYDAVVNAGRLMKEARANAVKLEGGVEVADRIRAIVDCQIPVCAHIGLTPQGINALGGFKEARANAVKLEGGVEVADRIRAIVDCQIPVCAHIGLTPQGINALGGFKVQGKTADSARKLLEDAHAVEEAGAFAVVLEAIPAELAARVSAELTIPTIGIGAGAGCDGQVLVNQDMLGMFHDFTPKFVRRFAEVADHPHHRHRRRRGLRRPGAREPGHARHVPRLHAEVRAPLRRGGRRHAGCLPRLRRRCEGRHVPRRRAHLRRPCGRAGKPLGGRPWRSFALLRT